MKNFLPCRHFFEIEKSGIIPCIKCGRKSKIAILESAETKEDVEDIHARFNELAGKIIVKNIAELEKAIIKKYNNEF